MLEILITVLIAAILYLLPGYLLLQLVNLRGTSRTVRFFLALCLSLVFVPCVFITVGNIYSFIPAGLPWLILVVTLLVMVLILHRKNTRQVVEIADAGGDSAPAGLLEKLIAWGWIVIFPLVSLLPRLDMLLFGTATHDVGTWDETWHLAQLVSVARTGLLPGHYMFPSISLSYYYGSWIYPAILGNLPWLEVPLARTMALHAYITTFAFLGIIYCYLLTNYKQWWVRITGLAFFTILGGFDLYASMSNPANAEWWQGTVSWLIQGFQVSQFVTLYAWVPQHLAAGMAFTLCLLVWKNSITPIAIKCLVAVITLAFSFITSPFVFIFFVLACILFAAFHANKLISVAKKAPLTLIAYCGVSLVIFLAVTWRMIFSVSGRSTFVLSTFRVPIFETLIGTSRWSVIFDRILTFLGFPIVASWIGLIELGLPFLLYLYWLIRRLTSRQGFPNPYDALFAFFPPLSFFIVMIVDAVGAGRNLAMRGLIPAQILILFTALISLESIAFPRQLWKRVAIIYIAGCFIIAQGASALAQVKTDSWPVVVETRQHLSDPQPEAGVKPYEYITWLNNNTPRNSLVLESGCISTSDQLSYRWLERSRYIMPACGIQMDLFNRDRDFYIPAEWRQLKQLALGTSNILELYQSTQFWQKGKVPLYLVSWDHDPQWSAAGEQVYQDNSVLIYKLP